MALKNQKEFLIATDTLPQFKIRKSVIPQKMRFGSFVTTLKFRAQKIWQTLASVGFRPFGSKVFARDGAGGGTRTRTPLR